MPGVRNRAGPPRSGHVGAYRGTVRADHERGEPEIGEILDGAVCWLAATCTECGALIEGGTCWNCGARRADEWGVRPGTVED